MYSVYIPYYEGQRYVKQNLTEKEAYELQAELIRQDRVLCWVIYTK